jgi:tetratricopeptide (TPR) repeat protein
VLHFAWGACPGKPTLNCCERDDIHGNELSDIIYTPSANNPDKALRSGCAGEVQIHVEHARVAEARGDMQEAAQRWQTVREAFPQFIFGTAGAARVLLKLHRIDEAKGLVRASAGHFDSNKGLARVAAQLAEPRQDWREAIRCWDFVLAKDPNDQGAWRGRGAAGSHLSDTDHGDTDDDPPDGIVDVGGVTDPAAGELLCSLEARGKIASLRSYNEDLEPNRSGCFAGHQCGRARL